MMKPQYNQRDDANLRPRVKDKGDTVSIAAKPRDPHPRTGSSGVGTK